MADSGKPSAMISGAADGGGDATPASPTSGRLATAPISSSNAGVSIAPAPSSGGSAPSAGESAPDTEAGGGVGGKKNHRLHRAEREADFIRMLVRGDFAALHALYESVDTGSEATVLVDASVHYFYTKGPNAQLLLELLKSLIDKEVDSTASPATLFRSNSAAAKMLSATLQHVGTKYLQMTLRRIVHDVCMSNPRIEIDPLKLKPEDNYDENLKRLTSYCELFFNTITKSIEDCPVFVRHVCEYVQMSAVRKFPESKQIRQNLSAVGGLLFLRFFCPAIFTPHKFAVVEAAPGPVALRSLILISKVMQMMANGLRFSDKAEQYMIPMNEFIDKHSADLLSFFSEASTVPSEEEIARLEQKQRQAFQERVLKDISNPLLVKTNDRISQMQDWKNNVALLSPRARARAGTIEARPIAHSASSAPGSVPGSLPPSGLVARSAPDLVREMSDDAGDMARPNTSVQQLPAADREHSRDDGVASAGSRGAADDADHPPNKKAEANAGMSPTPTAAAPVAAAPHGGSGESHPRRDEREQRADWLDIIHFYLHRNLDKIRVLMQAPELHEDLKHLEKVLSAWTVPEIETEESKRDKERKERERKEKLKEKEQQERRERELIELPAKDSPKEKDKETALEKATRRLLHKKTKNKGELESSPDILNLEEGEDFERLVVRLKLEKEKEEEQRKHVEKEKENLKKAKEMIEKELIALIDDSKKMRVEIAKLQKDKEMVDYWRGEAEKEKAKSVSMLEEKHQLLVKLARQSDDKAALDADRARFDAEREQMARERREADRRVRELEAALKNMTEERDELKETYKAYDARMKAEERERAKKVRERLAHDDDDSNAVDKYRLVDDFDTSSSSHSISSTSSDRTKAKERTRKKSEGAVGEAALEGDDAAAERRKERKKKRRTVHLLRTSGEQDKGSSSCITPRESQDKGEKEKKDDKREEKKEKEKKKRDKDDEKKEEKKEKERPAAVVGETASASASASASAEVVVEEMSSSMSSKSSKNTKTAKKEKEKKEKEKEKETSEESPADKEAAKEATREKRRSKRTNRTSVKKTKEDVMRDLKSEEEEAQQAQEDKESKESNRDDSPRKRGVERERTKETKEAKETKEGVVVIATSSSGSAAESEASVLPLATSAVVLRQSNRGGESSGDGKSEKSEAGGRAKNEGWVLSDYEDDAAGIRPSETEDGDEDTTERTRKVGNGKAGSYVAPRKSTNPLRKTAEEGSGIRRSQSYDALGYKESSGKRSGGKHTDLKELGKKMRKGLELKSHKHNLKRFENCFRGVQAVEWLLQGAHVESRPEAVEVCRRLLEEGDLFVNLPGLEAEFADDDRSVYQFV